MNIYQLPSLLPLYSTIIAIRNLHHILLNYFLIHTSTYFVMKLLSDVIAPYLQLDPALASVSSCVVNRPMILDFIRSLDYNQDLVNKELRIKIRSTI